MVGGVTWYATWWFASSAHRPSWGFVPGVAMFVGGAFMFWWGFHRSRKRELLHWLDSFISEGNAIISHPGSDSELRSGQWSSAVVYLLSLAVDLPTVDRVIPEKQKVTADNSGGSQGVLRWQLQTLGAIRQDVQAGTIKAKKGWRPP